MSAEGIMTAMATILPEGTAVQQAVIESALDTLNGNWPGLLISCPDTEETRAGNGKKQEIHSVVVLYLDQWDSTARTVEQIASDARAALETMKANVRANKTLTTGGTAHAIIAGEHIRTLRLGIVQEAQGLKLPYPMYAAVMVFEEIRDLWIAG